MTKILTDVRAAGRLPEQNASGWAIVVDHDGNLISGDWGPELAQMLGIAMQSLQDYFDLVHPEDRARVAHGVFAATHDPTGKTPYGTDCRVKLADGLYHWCHDMGRIELQPDGTRRFVGFIFTIDREKAMLEMSRQREAVLERTVAEQERQLADIRRLNESLERSRAEAEELKKVVEGLSSENATVWYIAVPEMTATPMQSFFGTPGHVTDEAVKEALALNNFEQISRAYTRRYIYEPDQARVLEAVDYEHVRREMHQDLRGYSVEYRRSTSRGIEYYRVTFVLVSPETGSEDFLVAFRNVDREVRDRRQKAEALQTALDAAERAGRAKAVFLNSVSHDIRTPMNGIIGMTAIAAAHADDPRRVKDCLDKISVSSTHLLSLLNDVLDISSIETGEASLSEERFNLATVFSEMTTILSPEATNKGVHFTTDCGLQHRELIGDGLRLRQIFINIAGNAIKFTPAQGDVEVLLQEKPSSSRHYAAFEFTCRDTGCGMKAEFLEHLFKPFSRAAETKSIPGTGLGLSIAHNLIDMMDGEIKVASEFGKGSTFTVTFRLRTSAEEPLPLVDAGKASDIEPLTGLESLDFTGKRVLLVEDNELNREIALELLDMTHAMVETAENGLEAVKAFEGHEPGYYSLILMDIQMPVMDGNAATRLIRASRAADATTVPVVAMSANAFAEDKQAAKSAGMNDYLPKPVDMAALAAVLTRYLGRQPVGF